MRVGVSAVGTEGTASKAEPRLVMLETPDRPQNHQATVATHRLLLYDSLICIWLICNMCVIFYSTSLRSIHRHSLHSVDTGYTYCRLMSIPGRPTVHVTFHAFHPEKNGYRNHTLAHLPCDLQELDNVAVSAAIWSIWIYHLSVCKYECPTLSNLDDTSMTRMSRMSQTLLLGLQVYSHLWLKYAGM